MTGLMIIAAVVVAMAVAMGSEEKTTVSSWVQVLQCCSVTKT